MTKESRVYEELQQFSSLVPPKENLQCEGPRSCDCLFHAPDQESSNTPAPPSTKKKGKKTVERTRSEGSTPKETTKEQKPFGQLEVIEEGLYLWNL